jgi:large subunit ribosomal protein L2
MKRYRPTTKSRRNMTTVSFRDHITASEPHKGLTHGFKRMHGRNAFGRITMNHRGGGHKRLYRDIDFKMNKVGVPGTLKTVEYDPNRTGFIGLVSYKDGDKRYILIPKGVRPGREIVTGPDAPIQPGNRLQIKNIPLGTFIYNVELKVGGGAKLARSAGNFAEIIGKDAGSAHVKLPSTEVRKVSDLAWASIGEVSNDENRLVQLGKAGRSRWLGIRPRVRGTAMNPVDHPHGGGEGRQGRGRRRAVTRTGRPTGKGQKSRTPKKYSNVFIVSRRRVGKKKDQ